jgi:hypothetical protein
MYFLHCWQQNLERKAHQALVLVVAVGFPPAPQPGLDLELVLGAFQGHWHRWYFVPCTIGEDESKVCMVGPPLDSEDTGS